MEIKKFAKLASAALVVGSFASCQDYEPFDEATVAASVKAREFAANFVDRYGEPDPNHTWGFEETPLMSLGTQTRSNANGETVDTHTNMWIDWNENEGRYKDDALALNIDVPGWPNEDGYYYTSNSSNCDLEHIEKNQPKNPTNYQPAGDITEYEVRYVSEWFRNNPNPRREELHLSDFFVQNVSVDYDRMSYPDGEKITHTTQAYGKKSTITGTADEYLDFALDYLHFMPIGADKNNKEDWTHINNFNRGNSNISPNPLSTIKTDGQTNNHREIKYVYSSGTEDFACRPSFETTDPSAPMLGEFIDSWVLVKLDWDEVMADGETHHRTGYYLAFDYQASKNDTGTKIECDGYYSNWIIKITPAYFTEEAPAAKRVMCEDLGNTFDFDFNDVVFDVAFHQNGAQVDAVINLQASGGTLPIYVGFDNTTENGAYEAHKLLGNSSSTPVNVGGVSHEIATYRIPNVGSGKNAGDIKIWVNNKGIQEIAGLRGNLNYYNEGKQGNQKAPQRFAVPTSVQWMQECKFIEKGYPKFPDWVKSESGNEDWYLTIGDKSLIQNYVEPAVVPGGNNQSSADVVLFKQDNPQEMNQIDYLYSNQQLVKNAVAAGKKTMEVTFQSTDSRTVKGVTLNETNGQVEIGSLEVEAGATSFAFVVPDNAVEAVKTYGLCLTFDNKKILVTRIVMK